MIRWTSLANSLFQVALHLPEPQVESGMDFGDMASTLPFTCTFAPRDLEDRWYTLT